MDINSKIYPQRKLWSFQYILFYNIASVSSTQFKMSNRSEREAEDLYERENDPSPVTGTFSDSSYAKEMRQGLRNQVPVQSDTQRVEDPVQPPYSNTDEQLRKSDNFCDYDYMLLKV